jgi:hypothetical protein
MSLVGVKVKVEKAGFAHSIAIKVNDKLITSGAIISNLNGFFSQVNGAFIFFELMENTLVFDAFLVSSIKKTSSVYS